MCSLLLHIQCPSRGTRQAAWRLNQENEPKALPAMTQGSERGGRGSVHRLWGTTVQVGFSECGESQGQEK